MQAGIFCRDTAAVGAFARAMKARGHADEAKPHVLSYPPGAPHIAVAFSNEHSCPTSSASRPDGSFAVFGGELFNRDEIAASVGAERSGATDNASLVLDLYRSSGPASLATLDAAATITIWDADAHELLVYRDRWGQMSQFYSAGGDRLLWASDLRALLRQGVATDINVDALDFFLATGYFPAPWTGLTHVRKIPPAHALSARWPETAEVRRFWRGTGRPKLRLSFDQTTDRLQALLELSLRRRYQPGTKTGVFLSGGVDSALLVGVLTRLLRADVETFTFQYGDYDGEFNETRRAADIARHFGTRHHVVTFTPRDLAEHLDRMVLGYEEPFTYGLHSYFLRDAAQTGTATLLSGAGVGDWYVGPRDRLARNLRALRLPFHAIGRMLDPVLNRLSSRRRDLARALLLGAATGLPDRTNEPVASDSFRARLYQDPRRAAGRHRVRGALAPVVDDLAGESDGDQITLLTQRFFIAECNLYWYARWAATWQLRMAHPYYDNDLQSFVMQLPRPDRNKPEMRRVAERFMPRSMAHAPKLPQTVPVGEWFRGPLLDLLHSRLEPRQLSEHGIFDPAAVQRLIARHVDRQANHEWLLWAILTTTVWQDAVLGAQRRQEPRDLRDAIRVG